MALERQLLSPVGKALLKKMQDKASTEQSSLDSGSVGLFTLSPKKSETLLPRNLDADFALLDSQLVNFESEKVSLEAVFSLFLPDMNTDLLRDEENICKNKNTAKLGLGLIFVMALGGACVAFVIFEPTGLITVAVVGVVSWVGGFFYAKKINEVDVEYLNARNSLKEEMCSEVNFQSGQTLSQFVTQRDHAYLLFTMANRVQLSSLPLSLKKNFYENCRQRLVGASINTRSEMQDYIKRLDSQTAGFRFFNCNKGPKLVSIWEQGLPSQEGSRVISQG